MHVSIRKFGTRQLHQKIHVILEQMDIPCVLSNLKDRLGYLSALLYTTKTAM